MTRRPRIVYQVTAAGTEEFSRLMSEVGPTAWEDDTFDIRFAFFSSTDMEIRLRVLEGRRTRLQERLARVQQELERTQAEVDRYAAELQRHGVESVEREVRWLSDLIRAERGEVTRHAAHRTPPTTSTDRRRPATPVRPADKKESPMGSVRVAIVGVGNCATSLIQGVEYYRDADPQATVPGLMHVKFGDYHVGDVEFVAAFDVDDKKVGKDLSEAINASENNTIKIADVPTLGVEVQRGPTLDGLGKYYRMTIEESPRRAGRRRPGPQGRQGRRPRLLPPGGLRGGRQVLRPVRHRRRRRLRQRPARLHRLRPRVGQEVRGRRRPDRRRRHQVARSAPPSPTA